MKTCIAALFAAVLAWAQAQSPQEILKKAIALQAAGNAEAAVEQYRAYLRLVPNDVQAISNLGAALVRLGRMEEGIAQYKLALARKPDPAVRMNLALAYYKMVDLPSAVRELTVLHKAYPEHLRVAELLADCYFRQGETKQVIALLQPIEPKYPNERGVAYLLGMSLLKEKKITEGERIIDRLFRGGDTAESHVLFGSVKLASNDFMAARDEFAKAVEMNPKLPGVYSLYGDALRETGDIDAAIDAYRKALGADPNDFTANIFVGARLRQDQNYGEAMKYFERALHIQPNSPAVRYQIAAAWFGDGKLEPARKELESLVKEWPSFLEAHVTLASVYYRLKRKEDGDREREVVRKLNAAIQARDAAGGQPARPRAADTKAAAPE